MNIIAFTGPVGSGKTTIAKQIAAIVPSAQVASFARPVKDIAKMIFGWDGQKDEKGRRLLQVIGTEAGRAYNENIWVRQMQEHLGYLMARGASIVLIDDLRFDNEAEAIRAREGNIVKLEGRGGLVGVNAGHASEAGIVFNSTTDVVVDNRPTPLETAHTVLHALGLRHLLVNGEQFRQKE